MGGLGLGVQDLDGYLDMIAATSSNANTDIDALMESFVIAGGTIERFNIPLEEANAFMGVMANRGYKGAEAGTAFNAILSRLGSTTGTAAKQLESMGISAYDSQGNFRGMEVVMQDVKDSMDGMTDAEKANAVEKLAGLNHGKTFSAMLSGLGDEYQDLKHDIENSEGALRTMRDTMKDNLQGALENLSSAFEEVAISLGTALLPMVKAATKVLQAMLDKFNGLSDGTKTTIAVLAAMAAGLALIVGPALLIVGFIPAMISGFVALGTVVTVSTTAIARAAVVTKFHIGYTLLLAKTTTLASIAIGIKTVATYAWGAAIKFLLGPISWIISGVALLVTGIIAAVKWFNKSSDDAAKLSEATEKLGEDTDSLNESISSTSEAYKEHQKDAEASSKVNADLAASIEELASKEKLSAGEKLILAERIEQLNGAVTDLNLAYDEEAGALNLSSEEMNTRIGLTEDMQSLTSGQERLLEIAKEQQEVDMKMGEINDLREEAKEKMENLDIKSKDYAETLAGLQEQEEGLKQSEIELAAQYSATEQQISESAEKVAANTEASVATQLEAYATLDEGTKETVDSLIGTWDTYKDSATDMFDVLTDKAEISVGKMTKNLEENQRIIGEWADNIAKLAERGVDEGLLETLREAGPESAGHVKVLVNSSDKELEKLSTLFAEGGKVATDALGKSLGIEGSTIPQDVANLASGLQTTLKDEISSADFSSIGGDVTDGLSKGIDAGSKDVSDSTKKVADESVKATKAALQSNSPSKVYKAIGGDITDGLALGINDGTNNVTSAIKKLFSAIEKDTTASFKTIIRGHEEAVKQIEQALSKLPQVAQKAMTEMLGMLKAGASTQANLMRQLSQQLITPFSSTPSQFRTIGLNAMAGMNAGLRAGSGAVLATARNTANSVASVMRQALAIKSPSRVLMEIGRFTGEGLVDGITSMYGDVGRAAQGLANVATPEISLDYATPNASYGSLSSAVSGAVDISASSTDGKLSQIVEELRKQRNTIVEMDGRIVGQMVTPHVNGTNAVNDVTRYF